MQGLCSISAHLWANSDLSSFVWGPHECRGYVAFAPTCGPILIFSSFIWGPSRMQGLCSIFAHLWANSDFVLLHLGAPENAGVM